MPSRQAVVGQDVERALADVVHGLREAGGANLLGVALYGSLVKGRFTPGMSDVNLLVVVADAGLDALLPLAPILCGAFRQAQVVAFVATPADLCSAARLFPSKILDMQLFHRLLHGDVHLAEPRVDPGDLRHRTVQELENLRLRLRRQVLERGAEPSVLWDAVVRSLPKLAVVLGTLLRGGGVQLPLERPALLRQAARELGLEEAVMARVASLHRRDERPDAAAVREIARAYLDMLARLAVLVGAAGRAREHGA